MSSFIDIEQALSQCGQGEFEKVVGAVLHARGVQGLSLLGSVVGKEKTRAGVPDAFGSIDGRSFTFAACTTETGARKVEKKLLEDIVQCADVAKTGVPVEVIDVLYLAFNSALPAEVLIRLNTSAERNGLRVNFLSISELSGDLSRRYPWIASDFFGIKVDTGQVLSIDAFVRAYDQGLLATPLDTQFLFRDADLSDASERVATADLVIKGGPGTGKTRFALEVLRRLAAQGRQVRCVFSSEQPVIQDINRHFSDVGPYAVLLDDANLVNGLETVVRTIRDRVGAENVRFVFTVRNYALREVGLALTALRHAPEEIELSAFSQEETEKFLDRGFGIKNQDFQRQIWRLSKGNARLATMAAKLALETQNFTAITDLTRLYDSYYRVPIERADRDGAVLVPSLALLSVLRTLRVDDEDTISSLERVFGWSEGTLWKAVLELHRLECVDLHRNRVARVSDQILASYAFFLVFVDRRSLPFRALLDFCGASRLGKIRSVMFEIQNTMDRRRIQDGIGDEVKSFLRNAEDPYRLRLLQVFWHFDPDFALAAVAQSIEALDSSTNDPQFEENASFGKVDILAALACFAHDTARRVPAVHLTLRFIAKQPSQGGAALSLLTDMHGYGIHQYSDHEAFQSQRDVSLALRSAPLSPGLGRSLLIRYAMKMLRTEFEGSFAEGMRITISRIRLTSGIASSAYRNVLWEGLVECADYPDCTELLHKLLWDYAREVRGDADIAAVVAEDLPWVTKLFRAIASRDQPTDCGLATALNCRFVSNGLDGFADVATEFESEANELLQLVTPDWERAAEDYEAEEAERCGRLVQVYADEDGPTVVRLFQTATKIPGNNQHYLLSSWQLLLNHWAEHDPVKLLAVTESGLQHGMAETFNSYGWVNALIRGCGKEVARAAIAAAPVEPRASWQLAFFVSLSTDDISETDVEDYLAALTQPGTIPGWIRDLQNYMRATPRFLPRLIETLLIRKDAPVPLFHLLSHLGVQELELIREQMRSEPALLAQAYLAASVSAPPHSHFDHNAALFDLVLDVRPGFVNEYVQAKIGTAKWISRFSENHRDYSRLWQRSDWASLLVELLEALTSAEVNTDEEYLHAWLPACIEGRLPVAALAHLKSVILQHSEHVGFMRIVLSGVNDLAQDQRLDLWSTFLASNQRLDAFKALSLLPNHWGGTGSMVPVLQGRVSFLEQLAELTDEPALIGHRMHIIEQVRFEQSRVDAEVESDFIDHA